jgi:hypothetical protein
VLIVCTIVTCAKHTAVPVPVPLYSGLTHNDTHAVIRVLFTVHYVSGSSRCNLVLDKLLQWLSLKASTAFLCYVSGHAVLALWH